MGLTPRTSAAVSVSLGGERRKGYLNGIAFAEIAISGSLFEAAISVLLVSKKKRDLVETRCIYE